MRPMDMNIQTSKVKSLKLTSMRQMLLLMTVREIL